MINVGILAKIRRMHLRDGKTIREISPVTGLSRNTVRGWLRQQDVTEPQYPKRSAVSVVDRWERHLEAGLRNAQQRAARRRGAVRADPRTRLEAQLLLNETRLDLTSITRPQNWANFRWCYVEDYDLSSFQWAGDLSNSLKVTKNHSK